MYISSIYGGFLAVFGAIVFYGLNKVPLKFSVVKMFKLHPIIIQLGMIIPMFLLPWLLLLFNEFKSTLNITYGVLGALFWVPGSVCAIFAIYYLGLSVAQGLMAGILGISLSDIEYECKREKTNEEISEITTAFIKNGNDNDGDEKKEGDFSWKDLCIGLFFVTALGLFNGTLMIFVKLNQHNSNNTVYLEYLVSFGIGVVLVSPIVFLIFVLVLSYYKRIDNWKQQFKYSIPVGMLIGFFWELGYFCSTYAVLSPLGLTIGFPLSQCSFVVAAFFGMVIFKELNSYRKKVMYFTSIIVFVLPGIFLLGYFGVNS